MLLPHLTCDDSELANTFDGRKFGHHEMAFYDVRGALTRHRYSKRIYGPERALIILPKILLMVLKANVDTLVDFLQVVQDHPVLKYADPADRTYNLYKAAAAAAEKILRAGILQVSGFRHPHNRCGSLSVSLLVSKLGNLARYVYQRLSHSPPKPLPGLLWE